MVVSLTYRIQQLSSFSIKRPISRIKTRFQWLISQKRDIFSYQRKILQYFGSVKINFRKFYLKNPAEIISAEILKIPPKLIPPKFLVLNVTYFSSHFRNRQIVVRWLKQLCLVDFISSIFVTFKSTINLCASVTYYSIRASNIGYFYLCKIQFDHQVKDTSCAVRFKSSII